MLRRRSLRCCLLTALLAAGCQKPPATAETTPPAEPAPTEPAEPEPAEPAEPAEPLPPAEEVLAASVEALGGKAALEAITSSYSEATTEITGQNIRMVTRIWSKGQNFYVHSDMPGVGVTEVWKKGTDVWSKDPINGMRKLEGAEAAQAQWSSDPALAANWSKYFDKAESTGRGTVADRPVVEVTLSSEGDVPPLVLMIDQESSMPVGMAFQQQSPMGAMPIRVTMSDFREVDGVKVPFRSETDMQLMRMVQVTEKYETNVEIDDAKFDPNAASGASAAEAGGDKKGAKKKGAKKKGAKKSATKDAKE